MPSRFWLRLLPPVVFLGFAAFACNDPAAGPPGPCADTAGVYLSSKLDDDDGDGNPADEDFPRINDEDDDIADHCWIRDARGVYHLFFHSEGITSRCRIEHYVSTNLTDLVHVGVALEPNPEGWDSHSIWAPHVVQVDGTYYMFYTGTTGGGSDPQATQRIGVATSRDLHQWTRLAINRCAGTSGDGCVYECAEGWTTAGRTGGRWDRQCRDPFVLRDESRERWLMFATAKSTNGFGVVTVAESRDLVRWTGAGYIDATRRLPGPGGMPTGGQAENPFVLSHRGRFVLLFTDWQDKEDSAHVRAPRTIVQYAFSPSLEFDPKGSARWEYRGYTPDPGVNATEAQQLADGTWLLSQSISNPDTPDHDEHRRELRWRRVVWRVDGSFGTRPWPPPCARPRRRRHGFRAIRRGATAAAPAPSGMRPARSPARSPRPADRVARR
jgi:hypothetical protein